MKVIVNSWGQGVLRDCAVKPGDYYLSFGGDPTYEFTLLLTATTGDAKVTLLEEGGGFSLDMDEDLVKKIKLNDDQDEARIDIWGPETFDLKENELRAELF